MKWSVTTFTLFAASVRALHESSTDHRGLVSPCRPYQEVIDFSNFEHGDVLNDPIKGGIAISAASFTATCRPPNNKPRAVNTLEPWTNCPNIANVPNVCRGKPPLTSPPKDENAPDFVTPLPECGGGTGILLPRQETPCMQDCRQGGIIAWEFPERTKISYLNLWDAKEVTVTTVLGQKDGTSTTKEYVANTSYRAFQLELGEYVQNMTVALGNGGAITQVGFEKPCNTPTIPKKPKDKTKPVLPPPPPTKPQDKTKPPPKRPDPRDKEINKNFGISKKCRKNLVRKGKMENTPLKAWKGRKQTMQQVQEGRLKSKFALSSSERKKSTHGPQQRISKRFLECIVPGEAVEIQVWVQLRKDGKGVACEMDGSSNLCPGLSIRAFDDAENRRTWTRREYSSTWKPDGWNLLRATPTMWEREEGSWTGNLKRMFLRINGMDPDLELLVDDVSFRRIQLLV